MVLEANILLQDKVAPVYGGLVNSVSENMDEVARYWIAEADEALTILQHLFEKGDFSYALFFGHLAVEKLIKAAYVLKNKEHAPPIHNLPRLARMAGLLLSPERREQLGESRGQSFFYALLSLEALLSLKKAGKLGG